MNNKLPFLLLLIISTLLLTSCKKGPTVISTSVEESPNSNSSSTGIFSNDGELNNLTSSSPPVTGDVHVVKVKEVQFKQEFGKYKGHQLVTDCKEEID